MVLFVLTVLNKILHLPLEKEYAKVQEKTKQLMLANFQLVEHHLKYCYSIHYIIIKEKY